MKRVDGETLYLAERGELPWAEAARVYDAAGEEIAKADFTDLICGTDCGDTQRTGWTRNGIAAGL